MSAYDTLSHQLESYLGPDLRDQILEGSEAAGARPRDGAVRLQVRVAGSGGEDRQDAREMLLNG